MHALRVQPDGPSADDLVELHLRQIVALNRWDDKYSYSVYVLYELELQRLRISILYIHTCSENSLAILGILSGQQSPFNFSEILLMVRSNFSAQDLRFADFHTTQIYTI